jgi:microcompartment protein CcmL/EutN
MTTKALGLIETIGLAAAIEAADSAIKAANVKLLGYENTKGGGRITIKLVGDVGAVKAAVAAGAAAALRIGRVESCLVIPRPHQEINALIGAIDRGPAAASAAAVAETAPAPVKPSPPARKNAPAVPPAPPKAKPAPPKAAPSKPKPASSRRPKAKPPAPAAESATVEFIEPLTLAAPVENPKPASEPEALQVGSGEGDTQSGE